MKLLFSINYNNFLSNAPFFSLLRGLQKRLYFSLLVADRRDLVSGRPNVGFLAFFGLLAVFFFFFLAAAVPAAAFLALLRLTFFTSVFFLCATFFLPGLERFLLALKEPEAPAPFTWTKSLLATSRLRAVMILALFASTSYPPAFRAFFRNASDTPELASAADAAFMMRSDTDDPAIPLRDVAPLLEAAEDIVKSVFQWQRALSALSILSDRFL